MQILHGHFFAIFFCQFDYFNALLVNTMDEEGNFIELGGEFPLEENEHFNKLSVNTLMSDIQVPTNVYNKGMIISMGFVSDLNSLVNEKKNHFVILDF